MESARPLNLMDVESLVQSFLKEHEQGIATLHSMYFKSGNQLSLRALQEGLVEELRTGCVSFINRDSPLDELDNYLFYIVNEYCKRLVTPQQKKKTEYLCPGCLFLGQENLIFLDKIFECDECKEQLTQASDPKKIVFFKAFCCHNKTGYRCPRCERFIPHPLDNSNSVSCPYLDCFFVGDIKDLRKMHHPTSQSNPEKLVLDTTADGTRFFKDSVPSGEISVDDQIEIEQDLQNKIRVLKEVIDIQMNNVPYSSSDFTIKQKQLVYQTFQQLLDEFPTDMVGYLLNQSRSGGFQNKLFQRYVSLLESAMPFYVIKGGKEHKVVSLLDKNLSIFDGISVFETVVNEKSEIKNKTKEFYIGSRKGAYAKPYFIGKLLSVIDIDSKASLMSSVKEYGFFKISLEGVAPGTKVAVTHLRVPPHYGMGAMTYVNRIRKKIVERANTMLVKS